MRGGTAALPVVLLVLVLAGAAGRAIEYTPEDLDQAAFEIAGKGGQMLDATAAQVHAWACQRVRQRPGPALRLLAAQLQDGAAPWPELCPLRAEDILDLCAPARPAECLKLAQAWQERAAVERRALERTNAAAALLAETRALEAALAGRIQAWTAPAAAEPRAPAGQPAPAARIRACIAQWSHEDFTVREAATTALKALGAAALPLLEEAQAHADAEIRARAARLLAELQAPPAALAATGMGRYRGLLRKLEVPADLATYGAYNIYGHWSGTGWAGHANLPAGHWVYVAPHWHIWSEAWTPEPRCVQHEVNR